MKWAEMLDKIRKKKGVIIIVYWLAAIVLTALILTSLDYCLWQAVLLSLRNKVARTDFSAIFLNSCTTFSANDYICEKIHPYGEPYQYLPAQTFPNPNGIRQGVPRQNQLVQPPHLHHGTERRRQVHHDPSAHQDVR